jgi:hypothetical protein
LSISTLRFTPFRRMTVQPMRFSQSLALCGPN